MAAHEVTFVSQKKQSVTITGFMRRNPYGNMGIITTAIHYDS